MSYRYRFEDGALLLEQPGRTLTEGEALRDHEAQLVAEPGSLVRVRYRSAVVFQSSE